MCLKPDEPAQQILSLGKKMYEFFRLRALNSSGEARMSARNDQDDLFHKSGA
jgi:hypothetical protein